MGRPKISILLPCLNSRRFLQPRIDSIAEQTFTDWEAIVLDSCSNDGSWELFKSVAAGDARFRLYQIPREGLYPALNRGLDLATGEFLHIATCDDTMHATFLREMLEAFARFPMAGIAACDVSFINEGGDLLTANDMVDYLATESIDALLKLDTVRTGWPANVRQSVLNYRPPPHDCLLHFNARSVYFSLTQLLIRTAEAQAQRFDPTLGSRADMGWLLNLTSRTGTVHVPKKLATWRFHGDQLSVRSESDGLNLMQRLLQTPLPEIYERHRSLLTRNDCASLMLPSKRYLAISKEAIELVQRETISRLRRMYIERPFATWRALRETGFQPNQDVREQLIPFMFSRWRLTPQKEASVIGAQKHFRSQRADQCKR